MNTRAFLMSALIAGALSGLLGSLPLLNLVNCLLCVWMWVGGIFAVYLYRRYQPAGPALTLAQAASLGAVTGLIAAVVGALVFMITGAISMPLMDTLYRTLQIEGDNPFQDAGFGTVAIQALIFLILDLVLYPIFGALGGVIGVNLFWKKPGAAIPQS